MQRFFVLLLAVTFLTDPLVWADSLQEDRYFQDVTEQAWKEHDKAKNRVLNNQPVEIISPTDLKTEFENGIKWEERADFKRASKAYVKALSYSPTYPLVAEILWRLAACYEKQYRWVQAFEVYGKLYKEYPAFDQALDAPQRQFELAKIMADGNEKVVLNVPTDQFYSMIAADLFLQLEKQMPKTELAGLCQFEVATIYRKRRLYQRASEAFYKVILNYPLHPLVPSALYESGLASSNVVKGAHYDAAAIDTVIKRFRRFIKEYPEDERVPVAQKLLEEMETLQAEKLFRTGLFYLREKNAEAAQIYFQELVKVYPESIWVKQLKQTSEEEWTVPESNQTIVKPYEFKKRFSDFFDLFKFWS